MKQAQCSKCGNIQNIDFLLCQKCGEEMGDEEIADLNNAIIIEKNAEIKELKSKLKAKDKDDPIDHRPKVALHGIILCALQAILTIFSFIFIVRSGGYGEVIAFMTVLSFLLLVGDIISIIGFNDGIRWILYFSYIYQVIRIVVNGAPVALINIAILYCTHISLKKQYFKKKRMREEVPPLETSIDNYNPKEFYIFLGIIIAVMALVFFGYMISQNTRETGMVASEKRGVSSKLIELNAAQGNSLPGEEMPKPPIATEKLLRNIGAISDKEIVENSTTAIPNPLEEGNLRGIENTFKDTKNHYSLFISEDWLEMSSDTIKENMNLVAKQTNTVAQEYEGGFHLKTKKAFEYPYILISKQEKISASFKDIEKMMNDPRLATAMNSQLDKYSEMLSDGSIGKPFLDKDKKAIYLTIEGTVPNIGKIRGLTGIFLGKEDLIQLNFYSKANEYPEDLSKFKAIIDTFQFDNGYGY